MQNDVLKNEIAPWQEKGRWYHATIKSDGISWTLLNDKTDAFLQGSIVSGRFLKIGSNKNIQAIDFKLLMRATWNSNIQIPIASAFTQFFGSDGNFTAIYLNDPTTLSGEIEFWIFIVKL